MSCCFSTTPSQHGNCSRLPKRTLRSDSRNAIEEKKNLENIKLQVKLFTLNSDFNLQLVGYANNSPTFNTPVGRPNIPFTYFNNISKSGSNFIPFRLFILQMTRNNFVSMSAGFEL